MMRLAAVFVAWVGISAGAVGAVVALFGFVWTLRKVSDLTGRTLGRVWYRVQWWRALRRLRRGS